MGKINIRLLIIFVLSLFSCEKKENNFLMIIYNGMDDAISTKIEIAINDQLVFNDSIKRPSHADKFSFYKDHLTFGENKVAISIPKYNIKDELTFNLDSEVVLKVNLHYEPILDKEMIETLGKKSFSPPSVKIKRYETTDMNQYEELDHELLIGINE